MGIFKDLKNTMSMSVFLCGGCAPECRHTQKLQESIGSLRAGVTGGHELPSVGAGN